MSQIRESFSKLTNSVNAFIASCIVINAISSIISVADMVLQVGVAS